MVRWCWVNFQCRGILLIWIRVGQGPTALAVGADEVVWTFFLSSTSSLLSPSLWETARYRMKYCLKGPLSPKQPTNQPRNTSLDIIYAALLIQTSMVGLKTNIFYYTEHILSKLVL